jgi:protein-tyrosine phosphatase
MKVATYPVKTTVRGRLSIIARPRGGDWLCDEISALAGEGIQTIVSMLTEDEANELGLADELTQCRQRGIALLNVPVRDRSVPESDSDFLVAVDCAANELREGRSVAVHCRAGIGRSALFAASVLIRLGWNADEAFLAIQQARGCPVPDTPEQRSWVRQHVCRHGARAPRE